MGDPYDRYEQEGGGAGFMMGLLTGTVLGAGLGMLFAPKPGSELRGQLSEQAGSLGRAAQDSMRRASESASSIAEKGREVYGRAREAVGRGVEEAQRPGGGAGPSSGSGSSGFGGNASPARSDELAGRNARRGHCA